MFVSPKPSGFFYEKDKTVVTGKKQSLIKRRVYTVRGRKSRPPSPLLEQQTVERTFVSSMEINTEPFAKRAIFPVWNEMARDPTSNSSL